MIVLSSSGISRVIAVECELQTRVMGQVWVWTQSVCIDRDEEEAG
jgi:hypothetical protein